MIAIQNPALQMSHGALQSSIRAASTSPNRNHHEDSKNLVTLLNLSRRGVGPTSHPSHLAASGSNGKDHINAKKPSTATTIIHSDDEEMTFKQEPASPPPPASSASSASTLDHPNHRTNGKN